MHLKEWTVPGTAFLQRDSYALQVSVTNITGKYKELALKGRQRQQL
jgi:hypothetical protein